MKTKIFQALKTKYSHLGLGDDILQEHANALAGLGLVTDDNLSTVVDAQSDYLSKLQKYNDKRVNDALLKAKKDAEDEAAKKAKEEAEAKAKAEEEAKKAAEEAEAKKKAEEEERKKAEELKNAEIPETVKKLMEEQASQAKAREEAYEKRQKELSDMIEKLAETNKNLAQGYESMKKENEEAKAMKAKAERKEFILSEAKRLNIPQYRIDEGFVIGDDLDNAGITNLLTNISTNIKNNAMPGRPNSFPQTNEATKEEMDAIADVLVR